MPTNYTPIDAEAVARRVIREHGTNDPLEIARRRGIDILRLEVPKSKSAGLLLCLDDVWTVIINTTQNKLHARERFTVAHELGHYFCHRHLLQKLPSLPQMLRSKTSLQIMRTNRRWLESQANSFARELLMPGDITAFVLEQSDYADDEQRASELVKTFGVSVAAARIRLRELRLRA